MNNQPNNNFHQQRRQQQFQQHQQMQNQQQPHNEVQQQQQDQDAMVDEEYFYEDEESEYFKSSVGGMEEQEVEADSSRQQQQQQQQQQQMLKQQPQRQQQQEILQNNFKGTTQLQQQPGQLHQQQQQQQYQGLVESESNQESPIMSPASSQEEQPPQIPSPAQQKVNQPANRPQSAVVASQQPQNNNRLLLKSTDKNEQFRSKGQPQSSQQYSQQQTTNFAARPQSAATNFLKPSLQSNKNNSNPVVTEDSDLDFEAIKKNNQHPAHSFFLSQAQTNHVSDASMMQQDLNDSQLKIKSQRTQLTYMLNENDSLKTQVEQLSQALTVAQQQQDSERGDQRSKLIEHNKNLQEELQDAFMARDQAQKQVLLCRQMSIIFQHREENVDQALVDALWESELRHQSKDNLINEQNKTIENLRQKLKSQQHRVVVDNYIIGPSMIVLDLQKKLQKGEKRLLAFVSQVDLLNARMREVSLKLEQKTQELKQQEKIALISEEQMNQLRRHIETLSAAKIQKTGSSGQDRQNFKEIERLLKDSEKRKEDQIKLLHERQMSQKIEMQKMIEQAKIQAAKHPTPKNQQQQPQQQNIASNFIKQQPQHKPKIVAPPTPQVAQQPKSTSQQQQKVQQQQQPEAVAVEQPEESDPDRFSQRVFMEDTHVKHKDYIPSLDLSVVTGTQPSFIAPKDNKSPQKPTQQPQQQQNQQHQKQQQSHLVQQQLLQLQQPQASGDGSDFNFEQEQIQIQIKKPTKHQQDIKNLNNVSSNETQSQNSVQNKPIQVQKIPSQRDSQQRGNDDNDHQQEFIYEASANQNPQKIMAQTQEMPKNNNGAQDQMNRASQDHIKRKQGQNIEGGNLFAPSESETGGLKTDERLDQQRKNLFRMSSDALISEQTGQPPIVNSSSMPGLFVSQQSVNSGRELSSQPHNQPGSSSRQQPPHYKYSSGGKSSSRHESPMQQMPDQQLQQQQQQQYQQQQPNQQPQPLQVVLEESNFNQQDGQSRQQQQQHQPYQQNSTPQNQRATNSTEYNNQMLSQQKQSPMYKEEPFKNSNQKPALGISQQNVGSSFVPSRQQTPTAANPYIQNQPQMIGLSHMFSPAQQVSQNTTPNSAAPGIEFPQNTVLQGNQTINHQKPQPQTINITTFADQQPQPQNNQEFHPYQNMENQAYVEQQQIQNQPQQVVIDNMGQPQGQNDRLSQKVAAGINSQQQPYQQTESSSDADPFEMQERRNQNNNASAGADGEITIQPASKPQPSPSKEIVIAPSTAKTGYAAPGLSTTANQGQPKNTEQHQQRKSQQSTSPPMSQTQKQNTSKTHSQPEPTQIMVQPEPTEIVIQPMNVHNNNLKNKESSMSDDDGFAEPILEQATASAPPTQQQQMHPKDQGKKKPQTTVAPNLNKFSLNNLNNNNGSVQVVKDNMSGSNKNNQQLKTEYVIEEQFESEQSLMGDANNQHRSPTNETVNINITNAMTGGNNSSQLIQDASGAGNMMNFQKQLAQTQPIQMPSSHKISMHKSDGTVNQTLQQQQNQNQMMHGGLAGKNPAQQQAKTSHNQSTSSKEQNKNQLQQQQQSLQNNVNTNSQKLNSTTGYQVPEIEDDNEYGDEDYYDEEEEEDEEIKQKEPNVAENNKFETVSEDSMAKIKKIVESQARIPRIIVIKDQSGAEQEYEVLEESEEEEDISGSVNLSVSRTDGQDRNLKVLNKGERGQGEQQLSTRRRVLIEGEDMGDESFYIEEIIEESEEESDEMDNFGRDQRNQAR